MTQALSHTADSPRCLVVASPDLAASLRRHARQSATSLDTVEVDTYFAALGELGRDPTRATCRIVIGPVDRLLGMVEATATALRRLAPHATLLATAPPDPGDEAVAAMDAARRGGFDAVVDPGIAPDAVLRHASLVTADAPPPRADAGPGGIETSPAAEPDAEPDPAPHELGDTDLIDALLHRGSCELERQAVRLLTRQSGIADVGLAVDPRAVPPGHVATAVHHLDHHAGLLHAPPPATAHELGPWAAWLARWLALGRRFDHVSQLCLRDELTGVWNRRHFNHAFQDILDRSAGDRRPVTLLVFDIDDFKSFNDRFGHPAGDEILCETARLMRESVREHDVVARIGGDEFAVIFWDSDDGPRRPNSSHPADVLKAARRFQQAVYAHRFPKLLDHAPGTLTISGGLATYPWDGRTPDQLLAVADAMALESKRQGKNAITFGPTALGDSDPDAEPSHP